MTDLTIFDSRGFPVFGKRRIVYDMLELLAVLHFGKIDRIQQSVGYRMAGYELMSLHWSIRMDVREVVTYQ